MSASDENGKITFLDSDEQIKSKIGKAFCKEKDVELATNPLLAIAKYILFPINNDTVSYNSLERDWLEGVLSAQELKRIVATSIIEIVKPIRDKLKENIHLYEKAYM